MKRADSISVSSTVRAAKDQVFSNLGEEVAILQFKRGIYYGLDGVGFQVWQLIQQPRSVAQIQEAVLQQYTVDAARCRKDLLILLRRLLEEDLIEITE